MPRTLSISASDHWDDAGARLSDPCAELPGAVTRLYVPIVAWRFSVVRSFIAHHGPLFPVQKNGMAETIAATRKNCARRNFQTSHNRNLSGNGSFNATPVAALARGVLDTQRAAAQA
jgi:hypothetical protein